MSDIIVTRAKSPTEHLCNICIYDFPECEPEEGLLEFGTGTGNDNIIACGTYEAKVKCDHSFTGNDYLCVKCGQYFPETNREEQR